MREEIIKNYPTNYRSVVNYLTYKVPNKKNIWYQKHMAHHLIDLNEIDWIKKCENCILIRHPKDVINSYTAKNKLQSAEELGYPQQFKIAKFLKKSNKQFQVIDSEDLLKNPKNYYLIGAKISILILTNLCLSGKKEIIKTMVFGGNTGTTM